MLQLCSFSVPDARSSSSGSRFFFIMHSIFFSLSKIDGCSFTPVFFTSMGRKQVIYPFIYCINHLLCRRELGFSLVFFGFRVSLVFSFTIRNHRPSTRTSSALPTKTALHHPVPYHGLFMFGPSLAGPLGVFIFPSVPSSSPLSPAPSTRMALLLPSRVSCFPCLLLPLLRGPPESLTGSPP